MLSDDDDELLERSSASDSCDDEEYDDSDSGAGSDDVDILELGEPGEELCQVGFQSCSVPIELYDLSDLGQVLSVDTWNSCLFEEERLSLAEYLPDLDEEAYMKTMKELFQGENFHFGSPIVKLFDMLKGGLCEPRVQVYQQGLNFLQKCKHYHMLQQYQNSMNDSLVKIRNTWAKCRGDSTKEKVRVLNLKRNRQSLMSDTDSDDWVLKKHKYGPKIAGLTDGSSQERAISLKRGKFEIQNPQRVLKLAGSEVSCVKKSMGHFSLENRGLETRPTAYASRHVSETSQGSRGQVKVEDDAENRKRDQNAAHGSKIDLPMSLRNFALHSRSRNAFDCKSQVLKRPRYFEKLQQPSYDGKIHEAFTLDHSVKKWKVGEEPYYVKKNVGPKRTFSPQMNDNYRSKSSLKNMGRESESEYDSSPRVDEEDTINPSRNKFGYPSDPLEGRRASVKSVSEFRKANIILKGNASDPRYLQKYSVKNLNSDFSCFADLPLKIGHMQRGIAAHSHSLTPSSYKNSYTGVRDSDAHGTPRLMGSKGKTPTAHLSGRQMTLTGCNSVAGKQKGKADVAYMDGSDESDYYLNSSPQKQVDDSSCLKVLGEKKLESESGHVPNVDGLKDSGLETKPAKKPFILITPTVHHDFSFSIIHFLSAVRIAMVTPNETENVNVEPPTVHPNENMDVSTAGRIGHNTPSALSVQEIINRVRSNPGDPCILEIQEPLQDLIRGALKIFSAKTAPLGAKGWKVLVSYETSLKGWSWVGPNPPISCDPDKVEEVTSSEGWGLPHKMLVKLVDSFANWLKNVQETLRQIGTLPPPPLALMQLNLDDPERFRDSRAQRSLATIGPSSEEVRSYFRKEEVLRYLLPDRAFSYTATDGRKSSVAPLRRCGGKLTSKAREHFMLKIDRPAHVTILCLVRDAAARLPGSIGTRADVCTLIRDSQYLVEDISDAQINQVISGALDRLHYERDPCVKFDGARKLWAYLHRDREEEDFQDDGTASTKKWRRPKKDPTEQTDRGTVDIADQETHGTQATITGSLSTHLYGLTCDLNIEPPSMPQGERKELEPPSMPQGERIELQSNVLRSNREEITPQFHPMSWAPINLNLLHENKMLRQEHSSIEDFGDKTFIRDRPVGLFRTGIS
ncbi:hypothetical protein GIB67_018497 [Kingdonia uniflora]|uniref:DEUBAD domain-containing protein n=1 Tax=Kingdonia uniflora TaxID=39325 RepID=A0A7J7LWB1_9MAGN|nr:hypothetical protein GIB67_018497 [Kingdonia uniflora]